MVAVQHTHSSPHETNGRCGSAIELVLSPPKMVDRSLYRHCGQRVDAKMMFAISMRSCRSSREDDDGSKSRFCPIASGFAAASLRIMKRANESGGATSWYWRNVSSAWSSLDHLCTRWILSRHTHTHTRTTLGSQEWEESGMFADAGVIKEVRGGARRIVMRVE